MSKQPSTDKHAFICPHCTTFAHQYWYGVMIDRLNEGPHLTDE